MCTAGDKCARITMRPGGIVATAANCQSSTVRYWSIQLLYILLLIVITSTLYLFRSDVFINSLHLNVTRPDPTVVSAGASVVQTTHHSSLATSTASLCSTTWSTAAISTVTGTSRRWAPIDLLTYLLTYTSIAVDHVRQAGCGQLCQFFELLRTQSRSW